MHEQAVQRLQSDWGTESFGRTEVSHAANLCPLSGDYGSRPKKPQNCSQIYENMHDILPYNSKNGTKGDTNLTCLES